MNQQQWNEGLDHMDEDLLRNYLTAKDQYVHKRRNRQRFFHVAAAAACLCLIVGVLLLVQHYRNNIPQIGNYKRIQLTGNTLGESVSSYITQDTAIVNEAKENLPTQLPIYKITPRKISSKEFQAMKEQLGLPDSDSPLFGVEKNKNKVDGRFTYYATGTFTMSEEELEALAWETFHKLSFLEGEYVYSGIRGEDTISAYDGEIVTSVLVSFYRQLDGVRVIGNDRCDMWFNDDGLVEIHIALYDYKQIGTMDLIPLENATSRIKTPDGFSLEGSLNSAVETLRVDRINLVLVNQHSNDCTILQPVYNFIGTAIGNNETEVGFSSKIIAIPESYTYEAD